jgi:hypothetical protein
MFNLLVLIGCLFGIPVAIAKFLDDVWLRDEQKRRLREKFGAWWITVADYDRIKFALVCTQAFNRFLDVFFGEKLVSKKSFIRCSVVASGLLISSLAFTGLLNHKLLGIMPWVNYKESCKDVHDYADFIAGTGLTTNGVLAKPNVTFSSIALNSPDSGADVLPAAIAAMIVHSSKTNSEGPNGEFYVGFYFSGRMGTNDNKSLSQAQVWSNNVVTMRNEVKKYDTTKNAVIYSIAYYLILFIANVILCFGSLVLCRKVLREICATGRVVTTISLLVSNFFCLLIPSSIFLLSLLILSVPLFWILIPYVGVLAKESLLVFTTSVLGLSFTIWILNCVPLNLMAVIAFLPFFFSLFATFFSLITMLGRNWIHSFVSAVLLRCAEKSPPLVIGGIFGLIVSLITILAKLIRGTF